MERDRGSLDYILLVYNAVSTYRLLSYIPCIALMKQNLGRYRRSQGRHFNSYFTDEQQSFEIPPPPQPPASLLVAKCCILCDFLRATCQFSFSLSVSNLLFNVSDARQGKFPQIVGEAKPCTERRRGSFGREYRKNSTHTPESESKKSLLERG